MTFDVLIKHDTVIDGMRAPGIRADVGGTAGRLTAIASTVEGEATHEIAARGGG